jgi:hypothetical protein
MIMTTASSTVTMGDAEDFIKQDVAASNALEIAKSQDIHQITADLSKVTITLHNLRLGIERIPHDIAKPYEPPVVVLKQIIDALSVAANDLEQIKLAIAKLQQEVNESQAKFQPKLSLLLETTGLNVPAIKHLYEKAELQLLTEPLPNGDVATYKT